MNSESLQPVHTTSQQRASNFELCRLISMFYIVVYHLFIHNVEVTGDFYYTRALTSIFFIGVPVFVMISGYFGIKASVKGFLSLVSQIVFYSLIALLICHFVFNEPISKGNICGIIFPVTKTEYWFVSTYMLLYILSPFINRMINVLTKKQFIALLITLLVSVCYWGGLMNGPNSGDRSIMTFLLFYCVGRFIHIYYSTDLALPSILKRPWFLYALLILLFFILVSFLPEPFNRGVNVLVSAYNRIGVVILSALFILCFQSLKIQRRWINIMAKSTFAVYLIHGNNIVTYHRWVYNVYTNYALQLNDLHARLAFLFGVALIVFFACLLIDQIRIFLFKYVGVDKSISQINDLFVRYIKL